MTVVFINSAQSQGNDAATTGAIDTTGANFLCAGLAMDGSFSSPVLSDSKGNSWTSLTATDNANLVRSRLYYSANPTVGSGHTFTWTRAGAPISMIFMSFSGVLAVSPYDSQENGAGQAGGTSIQPGSVTPSVDGALILTVLSSDTVLSTFNIDNGFTIVDHTDETGSIHGVMTAYLVQGTAGAMNPTWSWTASPGNDPSTRIAVFKPAVSVAAARIPRRMLAGMGA